LFIFYLEFSERELGYENALTTSKVNIDALEINKHAVTGMLGTM
jgi:hypothetical protein